MTTAASVPSGPFAHAGIVVADLAAAQQELSAGLGVVWGQPIEVTVGELRVLVSFAQPGPPWLELVQQVDGPPGTVFDASGGPRLHHLGFWADDLDATSAHLGAAGLPLEYDARPVGRQILYHLGRASGLRVELHRRQDRRSFYERWGFPEPPED